MKSKKKLPYYKVRFLSELTQIKSEDQLLKLNTNRLLSYYKAERRRRISYNEHFNCDDHTYAYEIDGNYSYVITILNEWDNYLSTIKSVLNQREHVK